MLPRRFVVSCNECRRVVMIPNEVGPVQLERLRLHVNFHLRQRSNRPPLVFRHLVGGHEELLLRHFRVRLKEGEAPPDGNAIGGEAPSPQAGAPGNAELTAADPTSGPVRVAR